MASHLFHEGNTEQTFSLSGRLADPNMDPAYLGQLTSIAKNMAAFMPSDAAVLARYRLKYTIAGKLWEEHEDAELGFADGDEDE